MLAKKSSSAGAKRFCIARHPLSEISESLSRETHRHLARKSFSPPAMPSKEHAKLISLWLPGRIEACQRPPCSPSIDRVRLCSACPLVRCPFHSSRKTLVCCPFHELRGTAALLSSWLLRSWLSEVAHGSLAASGGRRSTPGPIIDAAIRA